MRDSSFRTHDSSLDSPGNGSQRIDSTFSNQQADHSVQQTRSRLPQDIILVATNA
ncbi:hypothetical protein VMCG_02718 [Cytospora schulzeri]|uniref:Uncharacterized protein n=1 Tax=Cytospora schulzeri TaxID=448051 RepID=A0A423WZG3_9PEZI|nr:hypothetical protein VMCG_02718 [Valsa malicola]